MTTPNLAAITARADAATEGPWEANRYDSGHSKYELSCSVITEDTGDSICTFDALDRLGNEVHGIDDGRHDALFVAKARTDIPELVAEVERLQAALASALVRNSLGSAETQWRVTWFPPEKNQMVRTGTPEAIQKVLDDPDLDVLNWHPILEERTLSPWKTIDHGH